MGLGERFRVAVVFIGGLVMPGEVGMKARCGRRGAFFGGAGVGT